jgi:hypothetical protein
LKVSLRLVEAVEKTESSPDRKFLNLWTHKDQSTEFEPIKKQYEKMLSLLPDSQSAYWRESVGIDMKTTTEEGEDETIANATEETEPAAAESKQEVTKTEDEFEQS